MARTQQMQTNWIQRLPEDIANEVQSNMTTKKLARGDTLYRQGEVPTGVFELQTGRIKMSAVRDSGTEMILNICWPPMTLGELGLITNTESFFSCVALQATTVSFLPAQDFQTLRSKHPKINELLLKSACFRQLLQFQMQLESQGKDVEYALARRLHSIYLAMNKDMDEAEVVISVNQEELGSMVGCSRQTINQILKDWEADGLIKIVYGGVMINSLTELLSSVGTDDGFMLW